MQETARAGWDQSLSWAYLGQQVGQQVGQRQQQARAASPETADTENMAFMQNSIVSVATF